MTQNAKSKGDALTVTKLWDYIHGLVNLPTCKNFIELCGDKVNVKHIDIISRTKRDNVNKEHRISFSANEMKFSSGWGSTWCLLFYLNGVVSALSKAVNQKAIVYSAPNRHALNREALLLEGITDAAAMLKEYRKGIEKVNNTFGRMFSQSFDKLDDLAGKFHKLRG